MDRKSERIVGALVAGACLSVLVVAACLAPSDAGHGTHEQLGLPSCGFLLATGGPCPSCGMTTSFAEAASVDPGGAFRAQPFGLLLVLATATVFWIGGHTAVFGSRALALLGRAFNGRVLWGVGLLWAASWVYKIATWQG